ncbi:ferredoxin family protein [bacterium]|nr:ferredoxin family protein [bacterium]MDA7925600.1 ferredoxin family protein [Mariniblastus sp.]MDA7904648.1 ferredoxin family protein [bacterium]MDB4357262.1 ferredoxin family protein [Mariniblastus sp.]MDB4372620.1 ferredoxin family protein [Mariniblastus sp.]
MAKRISVVVSQSPSKNPAKRKLEEDIVAGLLFENGIDVTIVPNLYDIKPESTGMLALRQIAGNVVVVSWLFERAAHWILDRNAITGHVGEVLLKNDDEEEDDADAEQADDDEDDDKDRVIDSRSLKNRKIYCLDLKISNRAEDFIDEVKRIHQENAVQVVGLGDIINGGISQPIGERMSTAPSDPALSLEGSGLDQPSIVNRVEESGGRRWYPVIDYSRCTNCMECIDFCLFGVYGVDAVDTILVEQPDNCRKGCPACSRVCPENAIMFPQHKTPAIAGSSDGVASMKIDLSQLFGAPADGKSAEELAALERDEQLIAVGRDAVGMTAGVPRRQEDKSERSKDGLDDLVDQLNDLDI